MAKTSSSRPPRRPKVPAAVLAAVEAIRQKKGDDVVLLDLRKADAFTDFFIVCTGHNRRQAQAIADAVETALKAKKLRPTHVEGYTRGEWVLLDYFDFIVHVFAPSSRTFYGLERLWAQAVPVDVPVPPPAPAAVS